MSARSSLFAAVRREAADAFSDGLWLAPIRVIRWVYPPWWFWHGFVKRWIGHDCDEQPILCRMDFLFHTPSWIWLDV